MPERQVPEPPWLTAKADQRLALLEHRSKALAITKFMGSYDLLMMPLTEPPEFAAENDVRRWDRTCDGCNQWQNSFAKFYTGFVQRTTSWGQQVTFTYGACHSCAHQR